MRWKKSPGRRSSRRLAALVIDGLEERCLLSGVSGVEPGAESAVGLEFHRHSASAMDVTRNLVYTAIAGHTEALDVYRPVGSAPAGGRPVIVAIHGGGWRRFSKGEYGPRIAEAFVPLGFVVVAPNYELSALHRPSWPTNLEDVQAAVAWVRSHASWLGANPSRIVAMGESAGANLSALLGVATDPTGGQTLPAQVSAVVAFSTPTDLPLLCAESPMAGLAVEHFLGGTPSEDPGSYLAASPLDHVAAGDAPMFLVHGRQDPLVPPEQSRLLATALTRVGVPNRLVLVPGGHKLEFPLHDADLIPQILAFLKAIWNS